MSKLIILGIFLLKITSTISGQSKGINLKGIVTSKNGAPFVGCTINLKGTPSGTTSQVCGDFEISIPENYNGVLTFSCFNTRSYEIELLKLKDKKNIILSLEFINKYKNPSCNRTYKKEKRIKVN